MTAELNATLTARSDLHHGLLIIRVQPDTPPPPFKPGQYAVLGLPRSAPRSTLADADLPVEENGGAPEPDKLIRRAYSISSSSRQGEYLEFFVALVRSGALTPRLFALDLGERLYLGPKIVGMFTLDEAPRKSDILLIATGTGLAPYISMLRSGYDFTARRTVVIHAARNSWDLGYRNELEALAARWPDFHYLTIISDPHREPNWTGPVGLVYEFFNNGTVERLLRHPVSPADTAVFLCGNPLMIAGVEEMLTPRQFRKHSRKEPGQLFVEEYWKDRD